MTSFVIILYLPYKPSQGNVVLLLFLSLTILYTRWGKGINLKAEMTI